ncbi:Nif3-like dinuclear metal center hexameric protein [Nautilia sp. PV-1]|uniref:Nif3-like dinuclear metal center hexameric protein n=1 Tax=Nautilia sp. PV-1 TaxID=2579250 RepID=UPI000FD71274|nr:Nif3-like dinuclear metal center hexameric protein [Nautilia sp. PV-1]AZV47524.1 Nif3-like dinuclear metal center hexameric protein [Nautilia sp. PV-1]
MKLKKIYDFLNEISPFELQEEWDNSGLLVGSYENEIEKVYLTLDLDEEVIENADENSLIIAHHPLIFKPLKNVIPTSFSTKLLIKLIQKNISFIAMHTNFDKTHLNRFVAEEILGLKGESFDFIYRAEVNKPFGEFAEEIRNRLNLTCLKTVKYHNFIKTVSLTTGAGMSLLPYVKSDLFLTGDIKYHEAMDAKVRGVSLIDIGHYESEKFFADIMGKELKDLAVEVIKSNSKNPFIYN